MVTHDIQVRPPYVECRCQIIDKLRVPMTQQIADVEYNLLTRSTVACDLNNAV